MSDLLFLAAIRLLYATAGASRALSRRQFVQALLGSSGALVLKPARSAARRRAAAQVKRKKGRHLTPLEAFMRARGVKPARLARQTGYSRQHLLRIRTGRMVPSPRCAAALVMGLRDLTGEIVTLHTIFGATVVRDLGSDAWVTLVALNVFAATVTLEVRPGQTPTRRLAPRG